MIPVDSGSDGEATVTECKIVVCQVLAAQVLAFDRDVVCSICGGGFQATDEVIVAGNNVNHSKACSPAASSGSSGEATAIRQRALVAASGVTASDPMAATRVKASKKRPAAAPIVPATDEEKTKAEIRMQEFKVLAKPFNITKDSDDEVKKIWCARYEPRMRIHGCWVRLNTQSKVA